MKKLAGVLALTLFVVAGCSSNSETVKAPEAKTVKVTTEVVGTKEQLASRTFSATVTSDVTATITPKAVGFIDNIAVKAGQTVTKGQILVSIRSQELEQKRKVATGAMREAESGVEQAKIGLSMAEAQQKQAQAEYDLARKTYERYQNLLREKSVSQQEFDQVEARYKGAQQAKQVADEGVRLARERINQGGLKKSQAEASVGEVDAYLSYTVIRAPFSGIVLEVTGDVGNLASPGQPIMKIGTQTSVIEAFVNEQLTGKVKVGQEALVEIPSLSQSFKSTVTEVSYDVDPATRNFRVKIAGGSQFVPGTYVKVSFPVGKEVVMAVPVKSIVERGQLAIVFVNKEGRADMRVVKTGRAFGDRIEILSGLKNGESIVVDNATVLKAGDRLEK